KVKKRVWVFFAEGQRSLPHPHYRKRCAPRRSFEFDITHEPAAFNHDRTGERSVRLLSPSVVAQMTRFGLTQKALVNLQARRNRLFPAESGNRPTESWQGLESPAWDLPQNRRSWGKPAISGAILFFHIMMRAC
ncbi:MULTISPECIES: hypothetical protein, partial [unclassified Mesorhizobium]|uniref:hypothetical protein n=1 Tax=unclassified Mesorhizobium TaxID=325217 RepID=UPI001AEE7865